MRTSRVVCALTLLPLFAFADHFQIPAVGGFTFSSLKNNHEIITVSPDPILVVNEYHTDVQNQFGYLAGAGLIYSFDQVSEAPFTYTFGLMAYYLDLGEISGLESPYINAGDFDTLDFQFDASSLAFLLESKIMYTKYPFQPYAFLGLGLGKNRLNHYKESPTDPNGTAVAAPSPFGSKTVTSFAYELGLGVQHQIANYPSNHLKYFLSLDWRYINLGDAELSTMMNQQSRGAPKVDTLDTQAIVFSIITQF